MAARTYQVKEVARIANVTVRALHHYDAIGLLVPSGRTSAGYRLYSEADLIRLQQVLLYREFGLPLEKIRALMDDPRFDQRAALLQQRAQLVVRDQRTKAMLRAVDAALQTLKGEKNVDNPKDLFDGFDPADHEDEARERWGDTDAYKESHRRTKDYGPEQWKAIKAESIDILERLASSLRAGTPATAPEVIAIADEHRMHIDRWFYPCSKKMHAGLTEMYIADPRFTATFDKHEPGLAKYLAEAVAHA